ncbi:MAG: trimethylamine methyltransferase family protein, partial [Pseudomonadota bacterium]
MNELSTRRTGGRAARRASRAAPLDATTNPVRAGMSGGTLNLLTEAQVQRIHETALDALEQIGLADAPPSGVEALTGAGALLGDDGRIRFPRALVEDTLARANRSITLPSRDGQNDLRLEEGRVHYGTAGAAVHMVDPEAREYRESTLQDLHDAARICDQLPNIHFVQRPMVARDITDNLEMDLNTIYACCSGTT